LAALASAPAVVSMLQWLPEELERKARKRSLEYSWSTEWEAATAKRPKPPAAKPSAMVVVKDPYGDAPGKVEPAKPTNKDVEEEQAEEEQAEEEQPGNAEMADEGSVYGAGAAEFAKSGGSLDGSEGGPAEAPALRPRPSSRRGPQQHVADKLDAPLDELVPTPRKADEEEAADKMKAEVEAQGGSGRIHLPVGWTKAETLRFLEESSMFELNFLGGKRKAFTVKLLGPAGEL